jgi:peptide-methionine (S)-S-oxide reductase
MTRQFGAVVLAALLAAGCSSTGQTRSDEAGTPGGATGPAAPITGTTSSAIFAGGCFWCIEASLEAVPGVLGVVSGYTGGTEPDPTYHEVSSGRTGHAEAVQVVYDSTQVTYPELLDAFWHNIDPLVGDRQFCDAGTQYRAGIFYGNETERQLAEKSKRRLVESGRFDQPIVTEITAATTFYPAEDYHQDYYRKNPVEYQAYRFGCGRDRRLKELWGDAAAAH